MPTVTQLNTYVDAAATAIAAGDYTTALPNIEAALVIMSGLPDVTTAGTVTQFDRKALKTAQKMCLQSANTTRGIQRSRVKYTNPTG